MDLEKQRQFTRFISRQAVSVQVQSRQELEILWTSDISKGGLFVECASPPPVHSHLEVRLDTPDGGLVMRAEVVHVIDPEMARQIGHPAGAGLQFVDLDEAKRKAIQQYVDGIASSLSSQSPAVASGVAGEAVAATARKLLSSMEEGDLYAALGVQPHLSDGEVRARIEELRTQLSAPPADIPPPQLARIESALRALERVAILVLEPQRRLDYDFRHGFVRADQRIAAARRGEGLPVEAMRESWQRIFPEQLQAAAGMAKLALQAEAAKDLATAYRHGLRALESDPFNVELRRVMQEWRAAAEAKEVEARRARQPARTTSDPAIKAGAGAKPGSVAALMEQAAKAVSKYTKKKDGTPGKDDDEAAGGSTKE